MNYIYYHGADNDGKTSGAVIYKALSGKGQISLKGIDYGLYDFDEEFNKWNDDDRVYLADFSFDAENMKKALEKLGDRFTWIDHHQTAIDDTKGLDIKGIRKVGLAACRLCWSYFYPNEAEPEAVRLIGMYDVWDLNKKVEVFQLGVSLLDLNPDSQNWNVLFKSDKDFISKICADGEIIQKHNIIQNTEKAKAGAFEVEIEGKTAICINGIKMNSKGFDSVFDPAKHDFMLCFYKNVKPNEWSVSFYSTDMDISGLAKKHGGGGHKNAAGCGMTTEDIVKFLRL